MRGTITKVLPIENGYSKAGKAWKKQVCVIETDDQWPKVLAFEVWNDAIGKYELGVGDEIELKYEATSRESSSGKWFTSARAIGVTVIERSAIPQEKPAPKPSAPVVDNDTDDDLPF